MLYLSGLSKLDDRSDDKLERKVRTPLKAASNGSRE